MRGLSLSLSRLADRGLVPLGPTTHPPIQNLHSHPHWHLLRVLEMQLCQLIARDGSQRTHQRSPLAIRAAGKEVQLGEVHQLWSQRGLFFLGGVRQHW